MAPAPAIRVISADRRQMTRTPLRGRKRAETTAAADPAQRVADDRAGRYAGIIVPPARPAWQTGSVAPGRCRSRPGAVTLVTESWISRDQWFDRGDGGGEQARRRRPCSPIASLPGEHLIGPRSSWPTAGGAGFAGGDLPAALGHLRWWRPARCALVGARAGGPGGGQIRRRQLGSLGVRPTASRAAARSASCELAGQRSQQRAVDTVVWPGCACALDWGRATGAHRMARTLCPSLQTTPPRRF